MKILSMLASPAAGGAEMLVRNLCAAFVGQGHGAHILFLSEAAAVGNPREFEQEFLAGLADVGVTHEIMDRGSFGNPIKAAWQLRRSVASFRPDLLHIHLARGLMCRSLSLLAVPTVYSHHNVTTNFSPRLFRFFDRSVDHYVAIGRACGDLLESHAGRPISYIPNGVPGNFAAGGARSGISAAPFILSVGSLTPQKDYETLIAAAALVLPRLRAADRVATFAIAGEGGERENLEAMIERHGLKGAVELLGVRSDIPSLMRQADILVNSSVHEGLPITLIEAAASGLPAVVTNVGGNPEVVAHAQCGLVVPPSRPAELADAIFDLLSDDKRHAAFSRAMIAKSKSFSLEACAEAHLELYQSLIRPGERNYFRGSEGPDSDLRRARP